jgi:hypothetical protein
LQGGGKTGQTLLRIDDAFCYEDYLLTLSHPSQEMQHINQQNQIQSTLTHLLQSM